MPLLKKASVCAVSHDVLFDFFILWPVLKLLENRWCVWRRGEEDGNSLRLIGGVPCAVLRGSLISESRLAFWEQRRAGPQKYFDHANWGARTVASELRVKVRLVVLHCIENSICVHHLQCNRAVMIWRLT
jgi:hypothetical protein